MLILGFPNNISDPADKPSNISPRPGFPCPMTHSGNLNPPNEVAAASSVFPAGCFCTIEQQPTDQRDSFVMEANGFGLYCSGRLVVAMGGLALSADLTF